jgi:hypothetical protein
MIAPQSARDADSDLAKPVLATGETAIGRPVSQRSQALGPARGPDAALTSLRLLPADVGEGDNGAAAVVTNAEALTRRALKDWRRPAPDPTRALAAAGAIAPVATAMRLAESPPPASSRRRLPLFSEVSQSYINMRIAKDGLHHPEIRFLVLRRRTFLDIVGDRPVSDYGPGDLQTFVSQLQDWPATATKRAAFKDLSTLAILEANKNRALKPVARQTLAGYLATIRAMMRFGIAEHAYRDPFARARIR